MQRIWDVVAPGNIITIAIVIASFAVTGVKLSTQITTQMQEVQQSIQTLQRRADDQSEMVRELEERMSYIEGKIGAAAPAMHDAPDDPPAKKP